MTWPGLSPHHQAKFFVPHGFTDVLDVLDTAFADLDFFTNNRLFADGGLLFGERNTDRLIANRRAVDSDIARDGLALDEEFFVTHGHIDRLHLRHDLFANACLTMLDALLVDDESLRPQLNLLVLVGRPNPELRS